MNFFTEKRECTQKKASSKHLVGRSLETIFCVVKRPRLPVMGVKDLLSPRVKGEVVFLVSIDVSCR